LQVQLHYVRHFALLASIALLLGLSAAWRARAGIDVAFASYGALHACAVTASLRAHADLWRRLVFVAAAALISVSATQVGLEVFSLVYRSDVIASQFAIAVSSLLGAFAYALLLRSVLNFKLSVAALAWLPAICTLAALAAFLIGGLTSVGLWVATAWWLAYSGSLWFADRDGIESPQ
jgi:hypothetical protein